MVRTKDCGEILLALSHLEVPLWMEYMGEPV